jgi:hypothetical protein
MTRRGRRPAATVGIIPVTGFDKNGVAGVRVEETERFEISDGL